ncbi:hypothetical protein NWQ33_00575 [Mycoplasmopsis cynos]|nr:hypothetical protein [Mycoplasmopsis cynos]
MFQRIMKKVMNVDIKIPFERVEYDTAISKYGSDKPDFRFGNEIRDINGYFDETDFDIIKKAPSIRLLKIAEKISKKEFKTLEEIAKKNGVNALFYFVVENGEISHSNFASKAEIGVKKIISIQEEKDGTYLITANKYEKASQALGALKGRIKLKWYKWAKDEFNFKWITRFQCLSTMKKLTHDQQLIIHLPNSIIH